MVNISQSFANGPELQLLHAKEPVLSYDLDDVLSHLFPLDRFFHQLLFFLLYLPPVEQTMPLLHVFLQQNDAFEILIGALMGIS